MMIKTWFPVSIYSAENLFTEKDNKNFIKEIYKIKKTTKKGGNNWNTDVYNTLESFDLRNNNLLSKVCNVTEEHTNIFAKKLNSFYDYKVNESWFNFYNKGDFQEPHFHANSIFSAVYFFSNPKNSGRLIFTSPTEPDMLPMKNVKKYDDLNFVNCHYNPPERSIVIFRSYIQHMVEKCNNLSPRITGAFNLL